MFVTVVLMYAPTERNGGQYWIMLFPWAAWLIAQFIDKLLQKTLRAHWISTNNLMFVSGTAAIVGVLLIQYLPFRTHSRLAPPEVAVIKDLPHYPNIEGVILDLVDRNPDFASASPLLWYLDRKIEYIKANEAPPKAKDKSNFAYVLRINDEKKLSQLQNAGWCAISETVHLPCQP